MEDSIQQHNEQQPPQYHSSPGQVGMRDPNLESNDMKLEHDLSQDDALLASLGYKAELKREFNALEVFGLAFSIMGLLPSIASTLVYSMPAGGPVGMVLSISRTGAYL